MFRNRTWKKSTKVMGNMESIRPTSLENLLRTLPAEQTAKDLPRGPRA